MGHVMSHEKGVVTQCSDCRGGDSKSASTQWDFDDDISSDTIVRTSKSKGSDDRGGSSTPTTPTTPTSNINSGLDRSLVSNHHIGNGVPPQELSGGIMATNGGEEALGIEDTVFVMTDGSPHQHRSSVASSDGSLRSNRSSTVSVEGSSGMVAVSGIISKGCG